MSASIKKIVGGSLTAILMALSANAYADPVERVVSIDVHNTRAQLAALDQLFASDVMRGQKATLWAPLFPGTSAANRTLVIEYESFADLVESTRRVSESAEWMRFQQAVDGTSDVVSNAMAQQVLVEGSGWSNHGGLVAAIMTVTDPAVYVPAFQEMIDSLDNPGSIRLMQMRYGGGATNMVALFSAPDPAAANQFIDELQASDAFEEFAAKVAGIRTINNVTILRRIKTWGG